MNDAQPIFCRNLIGTVLSQSTVPIRIPARNLLIYKQVAANAGNDAERGGFEPPVKFDPHAALAKRCDVDGSGFASKDITSTGLRVLPDSLPFVLPTDPELASLVQAWTTLPNHIKAAVMALVATASR